MDNENECDLCEQAHVDSKGDAMCAGHAPCRRRPAGGSIYCSGHRLIRSEQLGPINGTPVTNPLERLSVLAGKMEAWFNAVSQRLERITTLGDGEGRLRAEVKAFNAIASRLGYLLSVMARLDLDERLIRLDRAHADQMREMLDMVMRDPELALTQEQLSLWPRAFARAARIRALGAAVGSIVDGEVVQ